ncbi:MAG TPA: ERF family protein [Mycobacterium sp.]|nr:ERF family protein [Mycobacterium sp.]
MTDLTPEAAFAEALAAFQAEIPHVGKDLTAKAGSYDYQYADLTAITAAGFPLLAGHGLSFTCKPTVREDGAFVLRYALKHTAGHEEGGDYPLPTNGNPQQIGSAITYGRRYCLCAVTGIAPGGEDDDGAKASDTRAGSVQQPQRETDFMWLEDVRARLVRCGTPAEVRGLIGEATQVYAEGRLTVDDAKQLRKEMDGRTAELKGDPS